MHLVPVLPPLDGESTISWCARLARFHAGMISHDWLRVIELSRQDVIDCTDYCLERLARLTGVAPAQIEMGACRRAGDRMYCHRRERFGTHFTTKTWTTYCPACLLEDADAASPSHGIRVGQVNWLFTPIRSCPRHGIELVRYRNTHFSQRFQDLTLLSRTDVELAREAGSATQVRVSPLQTYVEQRFAGAGGPEWLDSQDIDQATKTCEMLGACLEFGAHCNLDALTMRQWDRAGAAGFEASAKGPAGICEALEHICDASRQTTAKGGPQAVFGRLYQWLQFNKSGRDRGPIREVIREHILNTIAIDPGANLFAEPVSQRRRHSVNSLAKSSGLNPRTVKNALMHAGLLSDTDLGQKDDSASLDAAAGEALTQRILNSLPITRIPGYLNCNRRQAEFFVRADILQQIGPGIGKQGGVLTNVAIEDLDIFLNRFRARGRVVSDPGAGMMDVIAASEAARLPVVDVVRLVLDGALDRIELLPDTLRFRSVLVDPVEVRLKVKLHDSEQGLSVAEIAARFGIFRSGVNWLRKSVDDGDRPFLQGIEIANARGSIRYRFAPDAIERFERLYVKLGDLAKEVGVSSKAMKKRLVASGVSPIMERARLNVEYYRRADL